MNKIFRVFQSHSGIDAGGNAVYQRYNECFVEAANFTELAQNLGGELGHGDEGRVIIFSSKNLPPKARIKSKRHVNHVFSNETAYILELEINDAKVCIEMRTKSVGFVYVEDVHVIRFKEKSIAA